MPYGNRVFNPAGDRAEGDKMYAQFVYNDVSGSLTIGMPVYVDVRDAAEFNTKLAATAFSPSTGVVRTGGRVVLSTTAAGTSSTPQLAGIYQPENPGDKPNNGDIIRVLIYGRGIVSAQSPAAGNAGNVGVMLIVSTTVVQLVPAAAVTNQTGGQILATATFLAAGNTIFAAASATPTLINAFVKLT